MDEIARDSNLLRGRLLRRRALALLLNTGRSLGLGVTFAGAVIAGVMLHSGMHAFRHTAEAIGNRVLADSFEGKVVVRDVQSLSLGRHGTLRVREAEALDPEGNRVIFARDIYGSIDLYTLIDSLASGRPPVVEIAAMRVGEVDVVLDVDAATGAPKVARTFAPKTAPADATKPPQPPAQAPAQESATRPRRPKVKIANAFVGHAHVTGNLVPPALDADADDLEARLEIEDTAHVTLVNGRTRLRSPRIPNQRADVVGTAKGELVVPFETMKLSGKAEFDGSYGAVPIAARAQIDKDLIEANVEIARATPEAIADAFPGIPVKKPIEVHAHVRGKLPTIALDARARILDSGDAAVASATGEIDLREGHAFKVDLDASHVDAQAFGTDVATDLSGKVHVEGVLGGAAPLGAFRVTTTEGTVSSEKVPAALVEGRFEAQRVTATLRAREPGIEANGKLVLDIPTQVATFDLQARSNSLRSLSRAPNMIRGAASARAQGKVDLAKGSIHATTTASGDGIAFDAFSAKQISASGSLAGPLTSPILELGFAGVDIQVKAKDKAPLVYPHANGHAKVALAPTPHVLDGSINIGATGTAEGIAASANGIHVVDGVVEARGVRVTGIGEPLELDARVGNGQWSIRAKSAGVDLRRAAAVTGIKELSLLPEGTRARLDIDVRQGTAGADGHVDIVVQTEKGAFGAGALLAEAHAKVDRGKLVGTGRIAAEGFGQVEIASAELDLPRRLDARSLQRTTGTVELRGAVDLSQGAALFAGENVERVAGVASFEARIERGTADALPAIRGTVRTDGLEVALTGNPESNTILVSGIDVLAHAAWDGRTEDTEVALLSWDKHGLLGSAGAKAKVPVLAWATGSKKLDGAAIGALIVDAVANVPSREIADLPSALHFFDFRGRINGNVHVAGTVAHPQVTISAHARGVREAKRPARGASFDPLDGTLDARWDGERAAITFALDEKKRQRRSEKKSAPLPALPPELRASNAGARTPKTPGHLRGLVLLTDVKMNDLLQGRAPSELPWKASAEVEVENLALAALPLPAGMKGSLTGRARVKDLNHDPSFQAQAHIDDFGAEGAKVSGVEINIGGRDKSLFAHATVIDKKSKATFQLASQSLRIHGVDASWDAKSPTRIDYAVENGRLAVLGPLVRRSISEIDGRVDGAGSISIDESAEVFEGGLAIQNGDLYVNALGEEITNLNAIARFDRSGAWRIDDASGKIGTGEFRASAAGRMKGLSFVGAEATLIATKDGIPLSSEGATFAEATGEVKLTARMSEDRNALVMTMDVPRANVQVPDRSTQQLEPLEADPTVKVGLRLRGGELDTSAVRKARGGSQTRTDSRRNDGHLTTRMTVTLGNEVRLEGRGIDVRLGGRTLVEIAEEVSVQGRIDLRGGTAIVHGRRFTVDRGTITFSEGGDPGNPTVVAAAYWDAPDRTRVWVEFAGPMKTGNLTLRSEPPFSKNEILSVLLFGRPDPNTASPGADPQRSDDASGATAVGSGFVASDLNRVLSEIDEDLDIETDTLSGNRTRTKLGRSFFDRRLKVQVGYAPGRTTYREPDTTYIFLNWQFVPKWSLVATRGDRGTSILDVLFQHRY